MQLNEYLDLTNLNPRATSKEIISLCKLAISFKVKGVCVQPNCLEILKKHLKDTNILKIVVPNWIQGGGLYPGKEYILDWCREADEVDFIVNIYQAYELKEWEKVEEEIRKIKTYSKVLKVIIESNYIRNVHFDEREKLTKQIIEISEKAGADWIKSDSGLFKRTAITRKLGNAASILESPEESLLDDIKVILKYTKLDVKAAGGIKTKDFAQKLIDVGVKRIGTSSIEILK